LDYELLKIANNQLDKLKREINIDFGSGDGGFDNVRFGFNGANCEIIENITTLAPELPKTSESLGIYYYKMGEFEKARDYYFNTLTKLPDLNNKYFNEIHLERAKYYYYLINYDIANSYLKEKDYLNTLKYYQIAVSYNINNYMMYKRIADIYYIQKDYSKAILEINKGMRLNPNDYIWPLFLHYIYKEINNDIDSVRWLKIAKDLGYNEENSLSKDLNIIH
jgi:tetratricopeptide (TPR) repeat protein